MSHTLNRRDFLTTTATAAFGMTMGVRAGGESQPGALPQRVLGKTGVPVSVLAFGGGSHFLNRVGGDRATVERLIDRARELGVTYFDTAASYTVPPHQRLSEQYYGEMLSPYRKGLFLATKAEDRDRDGMLRSVEASLRLLKTDHIDLMQIHGLQRVDEIDRLEAKDGALGALQRLKAEGTVRFIGVTGHYDPDVMLQAVRRLDVDTLLMPLNAAQSSHPFSKTPGQPLAGFEQVVLPAAVAKNLGVVAMKVMGQGRLLGDAGSGAARATPSELIRYALSLPVAAIDVSHASLAILEENVATARSHRPMASQEMQALRDRLTGASPARADVAREREEGGFKA